MGTGMSDRTVVSNNLGSMCGILVFLESSLDALFLCTDPGHGVDDLFPGEKEALIRVQSDLAAAVDSFEKFVDQLSGVDKAAFVAGVASAAKAVADETFGGSGESNE